MSLNPYQHQLNRKEWQDRSHYIKTRDNLKCQAFDCTTPQSILQVHHLDYFSNKDPWNYPDDMLITLCKDCHEKENHRYKVEGHLFTALKQKGFLYGDLSAFTTLLFTDKDFLTFLFTYLRMKQNG